MCSFGSSATLSDSLGTLLFYANHDTIWGSNNIPLQNGIGLMTITSANYLNDGYQGVLLIKQPKSNRYYYHFNNGIFTDSRLEYAIIDKSLNMGFGAVITKKNVLLQDSLTTKLTAIKHCNNSDIWITALCKSSVDGYCYFYSYLLNRYGINPMPIISKIKINLYSPLMGQMKFNLNGNILAFACETGVELFNFNNATGLFQHRQTINYMLNNGTGLEFSPNGKFLYVNNFQIEIANQNVIKLVDNILPSKWQLANNGKIYGHIYRGIAAPDITLSNNHWTFSSYSLWDKLNLGQISNPNAMGSSCNLDTNYISDYNYHTDYPYGHSLPDFPNFYIYKSKADFQHSGDCSNTLIHFYNNQIGVDSIRWYFLDDGQITSGTTTQHLYSQPGNYEVESISFYGGLSDTIKHCINIAGQGNSNLPKQISICEGTDTVINGLQPFGFEYKWNTGDTSSALKVYKPGLYILKYNTPCGYVTDSIIINTIHCNIDYEIPNVFTPNKDDVNDLFTITLKNTKQINYKIFNRWGNEIKSETITLNIFNSQKVVLWDGNINENIASNGTYFYLIELTPFIGETIKLKGFLNLFY